MWELVNGRCKTNKKKIIKALCVDSASLQCLVFSKYLLRGQTSARTSSHLLCISFLEGAPENFFALLSLPNLGGPWHAPGGGALQINRHHSLDAALVAGCPADLFTQGPPYANAQQLPSPLQQLPVQTTSHSNSSPPASKKLHL
jgi:hypothetical protein